MGNQNETNVTEEFKQKKEALRRRILEEELRRVDQETESRGQELARMLRSKDELLHKEQLREAHAKRQQDESSVKKQAAEIQAKLLEERKKKQARRAEETRLRKEEEESIRQQAELRLKEEEARRKADEDRARLAEEARRKAEQERIRLEEEARTKAELERQRLQEEAHLKAEEGRLRLEEEARTKAERERQRLEEEARNRADNERMKQEEQLRLQREEFVRKEEERRRNEEQRRIETEQRRREEEEQRRLAEERRLKEEEELRLRQEEEERIRREEEERARKEEERRLALEEQQRQEAESARKHAEEIQRQKEEQARRERKDKTARLLEFISNAKALVESGDMQKALVEVAKALVNDPNNAEALRLERQIKEALDIPDTKKDDVQEAPQPAERKSKKKSAQKAPNYKPASRPRVSLKKYLIAAVVVLALGGGTGLFFHFKDQWFPKNFAFAIVPWSSTANIPEETMLGTSMSEEVARQFERQKQPALMGFASSYGLTTATAEPFHAMLTMGYPYVLEGSVTKSPVGYNFSVRLVDSIGSVYWAQSFIRNEASLPGLPLEIASALAKAISAPSPRDGSSAASAQTTKNPSAFLAYLRGLELMHHPGEASLRSALDQFRQAVQLDENFAAALAAAATSLVRLHEERFDRSDSVLTQATFYGEAAVHASQTLPASYAALARVAYARKDYKTANDQAMSGLKYAPGNSDLHLIRANVLLLWGKSKEALDELATAFQLNPRDPSVLSAYGFAYEVTGAHQQATWYHQSALYFVADSTAYITGPLADALMLDPTFSLRESRRVGDAFQRRIESDPRDYLGMYRFARMLQVLGQHDEGTALLQKTEKLLRAEIQAHPKNADALLTLGLVLTRLGKFAEATALAWKADAIDSTNALTKYRMAQMLSLQMYSAQKKKIDEKKKTDALNAIRAAVQLRFDPQELSNADLFNMYQLPEYRTAIQVAER